MWSKRIHEHSPHDTISLSLSDQTQSRRFSRNQIHFRQSRRLPDRKNVTTTHGAGMNNHGGLPKLAGVRCPTTPKYIFNFQLLNWFLSVSKWFTNVDFYFSSFTRNINTYQSCFFPSFFAPQAGNFWHTGDFILYIFHTFQCASRLFYIFPRCLHFSM